MSDDAIVIEEAPPEPVEVGLPRTLKVMSEQQRREWITAALRGEVEDEPIAA